MDLNIDGDIWIPLVKAGTITGGTLWKKNERERPTDELTDHFVYNATQSGLPKIGYFVTN